LFYVFKFFERFIDHLLVFTALIMILFIYTGLNLLENYGCGERLGAHSKIMFLLTDGIPNAFPEDGNGIGSLLRAAGNIRVKGIKIVAVGVGNRVDSSVLEQITGDSSLVYSKANFNELTNSQFINNLVDPLCQDPVVIENFGGVTPKPKRTKKPQVTPKKDTTKKATPTKATTRAKLTLPTNSTGACRCSGHKEMDFPALKLSVFDIEKYPGNLLLVAFFFIMKL